MATANLVSTPTRPCPLYPYQPPPTLLCPCSETDIEERARRGPGAGTGTEQGTWLGGVKTLPPGYVWATACMQKTIEKGGPRAEFWASPQPQGHSVPMANALNSISSVCVCLAVCTCTHVHELPKHVEHNKVFLANPKAFMFF